MNRQFRYSSVNNSNLRNNPAHQFALKYALTIFGANAVYTFIPKNACSTMRFSIAYANGCVDSIEDVNWIHNNNLTFSIDLAAAAKADYTFTILRCPFERVHSAFMDKIVGITPQSWGYYQSKNREISPYDLSFNDFVYGLSKTPRGAMDPHWRPQVDFLLYKRYDEIFSLYNFDRAIGQLSRKLGLKITDTRNHLQHDSSRLVEDDSIKSPGKESALDLLISKRSGLQPVRRSFFTENNVKLLNNIYRDDIDEYKALFGKSILMEQIGV